MSHSTHKTRHNPVGEPVAFSGHWAEFWRVTPRTIRNWVSRGHKVDEVAWVIDWAHHQRRLPSGFRAKVEELEMEARGEDYLEPDTAIDLMETPPVDNTDEETPQESIRRLDRLRRHYARKLDGANNRNALGDIKFYSDQVIRFEESLRKQRLMADRLGLDTGELIRRDTIERWLGGLGFWLMRSIDQSLNILCPQLAGLTFPEEVRTRLEDQLLDHRFFNPLLKSVTIASGSALPKWFVARLVDVVDDYVENGAESAAKALEMPADAT